MELCTFHPKLENKIKIHPGKISCTSGTLTNKKAFIFSQKKAVLKFWKKRNPQIILYISGNNLQSLKIKFFLYFSL